jgi:hypothetical protein
MEKDRQAVPVWGASWLLPTKFTTAWGARAIPDKTYKNGKWTGGYTASLVPDRQHAVGDWGKLQKWINSNLLPIVLTNYNGASCEVTTVHDGDYHACWTPNASYGYLYIIAWED